MDRYRFIIINFYLLKYIKKIRHPKYGECIISQDFIKGQIKLWINNK